MVVYYSARQGSQVDDAGCPVAVCEGCIGGGGGGAEGGEGEVEGVEDYGFRVVGAGGLGYAGGLSYGLGGEIFFVGVVGVVGVGVGVCCYGGVEGVYDCWDWGIEDGGGVGAFKEQGKGGLGGGVGYREGGNEEVQEEDEEK